MLECTGRIDEYVGGDETRFRASRLIQDAVVRNLQTLAESSQRLTDKIKAGEPDVPWRAISGFRNILVHDYWRSTSMPSGWSWIRSCRGCV